jgi:hypothetical protein
MAVKFGQLNGATKIGFEPQKLHIYWEQQGTLFLTYKRNEEILEELHVTPLEDKLCTCRHRWF